MNNLDIGFMLAAWHETERAGLMESHFGVVANGRHIQQTWLCPIYAYCGAAA